MFSLLLILQRKQASKGAQIGAAAWICNLSDSNISCFPKKPNRSFPTASDFWERLIGANLKSTQLLKQSTQNVQTPLCTQDFLITVKVLVIIQGLK